MRRRYRIVFCLVLCLLLTSCQVQQNSSEIKAVSSVTNNQDDTYEDEGYVTTKVSEKINDDMPELVFKLLSYFNKDTNYYEAQTLTITESSTGKIIQTISIPELTMFGQTNISTFINDDESMGLVFEDMNFDGYTDVKLYDTTNGNYREEWIYFVWDPDLGLFQNDRRLNKITLASFDQEEQLIYGMERGSAIDHWYYTYQYIDGEPTLIHSFSQNWIRNIDNIQTYLAAADISTDETDMIGFHEVVSELNVQTGEMETTRDEYVIYPHSDDLAKEAIARFDASSDIGKMISADN